jgi:hypothetical protein
MGPEIHGRLLQAIGIRQPYQNHARGFENSRLALATRLAANQPFNNKHSMVVPATWSAGYRLVLHGLSSEMLHALLVEEKRKQKIQASARDC